MYASRITMSSSITPRSAEKPSLHLTATGKSQPPTHPPAGNFHGATRLMTPLCTREKLHTWGHKVSLNCPWYCTVLVGVYMLLIHRPGHQYKQSDLSPVVRVSPSQPVRREEAGVGSSNLPGRMMFFAFARMEILVGYSRK